MAEKLTDEQVAGLLAILRKDAAVDAKVQYVTVVKSGIKQHNVPESCVAPLFEALRVASSSQHSALVNAGFTALNHLLTRLSRQEPRFIIKEAKHTLPIVVEKMGDQKDKLRTLASQAMATIYLHAPVDAERFVRNTAMVGKNARSKEAGMHWLLQMHKEHGLQFRSYVPTLMELLEDADGMVRDTAKTTVIELFRDAPNAAKSDLKKQLKNFKVRPAIEQAIIKELAPTGGIKRDVESRPESSLSARPNLSASVSSLASERPITPMTEPSAESVEPSYVNTQRELDEIFREMHGWFEGRETEQNWLKREESMTKLRRLIAGNASDFPDAFIAGCRSLLDGIIKAVTSLRTSLSKEGCALVQDLANTFGPGIDPMVELLMQTFIKLCAATKKIASQLANTTVDVIISRATYTGRIMQHIWGACQDKNVQPRTYVAGWLKTIIKKEAHHKNHVEHSGGLDLIEKCIKKGLLDANPGVREKMRSTYWAFHAVWPARAETIMDGLDSTAQKLLRRDPSNPLSPKRGELAPRPGLGLSKSAMSTASKPSLRDAMMAQKKALNTRNLPPRPGSAMATMSPVRSTSGPSNATPATSATSAAKPATRTRPEPSTTSHGGISVAPMRPARRPQMAPRPATAGPYSVRTHDAPSTERTSPGESSNIKTVTPKTISGSPRRTAPRTRPGHAATLSETSIPTPSKSVTCKSAASPRRSLAKADAIPAGIRLSSPAGENEDLTLVVPSVETFRRSPTSPPPEATPKPTDLTENGNAVAPEPAKPSPKSLKVYEDPFTTEEVAEPTTNSSAERPVLEDRPVNEAAANLARDATEQNASPIGPRSPPEKARQNSRLLDSGIARVKAQTLDVHGFRKLQSLIRDSKSFFTDQTFDALLAGLFEYLESPLGHLSAEKVQDIKAQVLATIKLMLKKNPDSFRPHVSRGLESLLAARALYTARTHIVSGLELLADELVTIGDAHEVMVTLTRNLSKLDATAGSSRGLSMGLHVLRQLIDSRTSFAPSDAEVAGAAALCGRCFESPESAVRMDAVQLAVALHARLGDARFWDAMNGVGVRDDPKSLITYYVVKRQRERDAAAASRAPG
ncbi:hypothetical protein DL765_000009 [Monosporascus sp. GIB2]|nr:hypothetical protein DL765_000009 [Monosporascus sp. GIB2]